MDMWDMEVEVELYVEKNSNNRKERVVGKYVQLHGTHEQNVCESYCCAP